MPLSRPKEERNVEQVRNTQLSWFKADYFWRLFADILRLAPAMLIIFSEFNRFRVHYVEGGKYLVTGWIKFYATVRSLVL